ncbi:MARTX multifunctional-autoprocessing repeats-in-toxin holotoxin RtxA [Moritella dasanensis]|uniref:MARTX multifunctional-autoprocessing repeats-in-toxin holotoxin RtxA n=1 Tax=Moritella dasanensis TaxID=428031 RepID=UPI0002FFA3F8|nr:MARTX multifunctional-autoprocessing repeats-in-toxin holotoxin RtxA [Moritella dasanensis]
MGKPFWRSVEYFFTGNYSADDGNNNIVAIGFGGEIKAYGGDDTITVGSIGATVYTGSGNDNVYAGAAYLKVEDSTGNLGVYGAAGYADINKNGDGNVSFAGAAGGVSIDHTGNHGDVKYGGIAAYNGLTRKGLSGNVTFEGAGGYNSLWHETNQGNLYFAGAGAGNKLDRTWFNRYQGSRGDVSFNGVGAANSISSRVETGNISFKGAGADNHLVRKGKVGDITLQGAGASNRIERTRQADDVYSETRGDIRFEGVGGYNSIYSDVAHGNINFSGAGAYNEITRKGVKNDFAGEGLENANADEIVLTSADLGGSWIQQSQAVSGVKSTTEANTYLFAFADSTYTKISKVRLHNDPITGKLGYYATSWYKGGNHLTNLADQQISSANGFVNLNINGAYTLSKLKVEHQQSVTVHAIEKNLTEYEWITYGGGTSIDAADVTLSDSKMGGPSISTVGTKIDVQAVKSNSKANTYIYASLQGPYTKIVVVELANDPKSGELKYRAIPWYKSGDYTANLANEDISAGNGYRHAGYSLSDLQYRVDSMRVTSDQIADMEEYSEKPLIEASTDSGESSGDVRFIGAGGGNVIKSNVTRGNVYFDGAGIANVITHSSDFGNTEFNGVGAANVIVKSGQQGDLTFHGAGLGNVLVHQSKQGKMDVWAGGLVNVLVRVGDGEYLVHLLAYGNISVQQGNGDSRVVMFGGYNTHTQIGNGSGTWVAAGGFNVMTQVGDGDITSVLVGGANVLTKIGDGDLTSGMIGGANIITHISGDEQSSDTTSVALGGLNVLTKKGKGNALAVMAGGGNVLTHIGDGSTTGVMIGGANVLTKVGDGNTTGIMLGLGNVLTHIGNGQTLGVMGAVGNVFTKVGDGTAIAAMVGAANIFTHVGEGDSWALMGGLGNVFTKIGDGNALALMIAEVNVFTHIGNGTTVALMLAKGNIATKVGNGMTMAAMVGNANIFTHVGDGDTFAAMIGQANILTKVGNDLTAALMVGQANIYTHVGDGTSIGILAGEANIMTKVGDGTTLAAMFGKANIMTHVGDGLSGVLALGQANIVTKVGDGFMGVVAAAKANVVTHVGDGTTAALMLGEGNILTKVGDGTTVGLLISKIGNIMTHVGDGMTIGVAKGKANIITKVGDGLGVNVAWGEANILTHVGDGDRYNFAKGKANIITKVGNGQEVSVVHGKANIITHVGNGDDYTGAWGEANIITKIGDGRNVVLAKGKANIVTQIGDGDSFNALWSKGNIVTKVGDGMQVTAAKGKANIVTTIGNGLSVTATYGDLNINTKVGDGISVNVAWGKYNINTKVGDGLNVAVMKGKANANIQVGDGLGINASYAQNNVAIKIGNGDFYSLSVASSNTKSNKLSSLFDNIKQTVLGMAGSQGINFLVQGDDASTSASRKGRGAIATPEITKLNGFQMEEIAEVGSELGDSMSGGVTDVETPDVAAMKSELNVDEDAQSTENPNLIANGDFEQGAQGWLSTNGIEASYSGSVYGVDNAGHGAIVNELATNVNTTIYQDIQSLESGEVLSLSFDFVQRAGLSAGHGMQVLWNGSIVFSASGDESTWQQQTLQLTAQIGNNRIEFKGTGESNGLGYILDNVVAKSEKIAATSAVSDNAQQNKAAANAQNDKEKAEANAQRLQQEKDQQLAAVSGSQKQLEATDQNALKTNGQTEREALAVEQRDITKELTDLTQGLDALDGQDNYQGESGDSWRDNFAGGILDNVQSKLDDAKSNSNEQLDKAAQQNIQNQQDTQAAVAKSESGVAKGEENQANAKHDINDAKANANSRQNEALVNQQDALQAKTNANADSNQAQQRGEQDSSAAQNKSSQAQADAKGTKQDEDDKPDRNGASGSGLSGKAYEAQAAAENTSHVDAHSEVAADGRYSEGLTEQELEALEGAKEAVNRLQINTGIRPNNTGSAVTEMFTHTGSRDVTAETVVGDRGHITRETIDYAKVNLDGLSGEQDRQRLQQSRSKAVPEFNSHFDTTSIGIENELSGLVVVLPKNSTQKFGYVHDAEGNPLFMLTKDMNQGGYSNPAGISDIKDVSNWQTHTIELVTYPSETSDKKAVESRKEAMLWLAKEFTSHINDSNHKSLSNIVSQDNRFTLVISNSNHLVAAGNGTALEAHGQTIGMTPSGQQATMAVNAKAFGMSSSPELKLLESASWYQSRLQDEFSEIANNVTLDDPMTAKNVFAYLTSIYSKTADLAKEYGLYINDWDPVAEGFTPNAQGLTDPKVKNAWEILPRTRPAKMLDLLSKQDSMYVRQQISAKLKSTHSDTLAKNVFEYFQYGGEVAGHAINNATTGSAQSPEPAILFEFRAVPNELSDYVPKTQSTAKLDVKVLDQFDSINRRAIIAKVNELVNGNDDFDIWYQAYRESEGLPPVKNPQRSASANHKAEWVRSQVPEQWTIITTQHVSDDAHSKAGVPLGTTTMPTEELESLGSGGNKEVTLDTESVSQDKPKTELMSVADLLEAAYVKGKIRGESYQKVIDALAHYHADSGENVDSELDAMVNLRQQVEGYLLGHPDSGRVPALNVLLSQVSQNIEVDDNTVYQDAFSKVYAQLDNANVNDSKHLYIDVNGGFVTKGKENITDAEKLASGKLAADKLKVTVAKEYGQAVADAVFNDLHKNDLAKDSKGVDVAGLKKIHRAIEQQISPVSATLFIWKPSDHSSLGHAAMQIGQGRVQVDAQDAPDFNQKNYVSWWPLGSKSSKISDIFNIATSEHPDLKIRKSDFSQPAHQNDTLEHDMVSEENDNFGMEDGDRKLERFIEKLNIAKGIDAQFKDISEAFTMVALMNPDMLETSGIPEHVSRRFVDEWNDTSYDMMDVAKRFAEELQKQAQASSDTVLMEKRIGNVVRQFADRALEDINNFKTQEADLGRVFRINLEGLDVAAMQAEWNTISNDPDTRYQLLTKNCSTTVAKVLKAGGADKLIGHTWTPNVGVWTPTALFNYGQALQEAQLEIATKKQSRHSIDDVDTLSGKDKVLESVVMENDGKPPREKASLSPLTRFLNNELYGSKDARQKIGDITQTLLDNAVTDGKSDKVTLKGESGRLSGYYHHGNTLEDTVQAQDTSQKVVLFVHGSGSSAEEQASAVRQHYQKQGIDILAVNMRGYGASDGGPNEKGLYQDARTMFSYLVNDKGIDPSNIIIHGYSLGGPIAADLARFAAQNNQAVSGLLLDRPMPSMTKAITAHEVVNPAGIVGALSKIVNGQFSVEKNLKGLPKETPIMLLTDNEGLGNEGEKLRAKLAADGYQISGENTFYGHEASNRLMSQYAKEIVSGLFDAKPQTVVELESLGNKAKQSADLSEVFTKDQLKKNAKVFAKPIGVSYQRILDQVGLVHSTTGRDQIAASFELNKQIDAYVEANPASGRNQAFNQLKGQITNALFNGDIQVAKEGISEIAQTRPELAARIYIIAQEEANGKNLGLTDLMVRWAKEDPYLSAKNGYQGDIPSDLGFEAKFHVELGSQYADFKQTLEKAQVEGLLTKAVIDESTKTVHLGYTYQELQDQTGTESVQMAAYFLKEAAKKSDPTSADSAEMILLNKFADKNYITELERQRIDQIESIYRSSHDTDIAGWDKRYSGTALNELNSQLGAATSVEAQLALLLEKRNGLLIGESHGSDVNGLRFVNEQMDALKAQGVSVIGLEHLRADLAQPLIDSYLSSGDMSSELRIMLKTKHLDISLFENARAKGLRIVALDANSTTRPTIQGTEHGLMYRAGAANNVAVETLSGLPAGEKFVAIYGNAHLQSHKGIEGFVPGITHRLDLPGLKISETNQFKAQADDLSQRVIYGDVLNKAKIEFTNSLNSDDGKVQKNNVESWDKVTVTPQNDGGDTRFDGQLIIQTENDPAAAKAAANLAGKHPDSSVVVQLDADGKYRVVYGDPSKLAGKLRWQIVGHGRDASDNNNTRLSGYSATELAANLVQFNEDFSQAKNINSKPEYISIVGCSLISTDKQKGFAKTFITAMAESDIRTDVSARSSEVAIDATGHKHTRDADEQWTKKLVDNKVVLSWNDQGDVTVREEAVRNTIAEGDIDLSRIGLSENDGVTRGAIADNDDVFTAPEKRKDKVETSSSDKSDNKVSYSGNIQVNVGDGEFTALNWGTSNVGIKVGTGGFKSLAFGDNNVMVHIGNGDSKHSVDMGGYQALEGAQMFIGNRNVSFNMGRSNDLIVMMDKSIPTPPLVNPFDGAARISGVLQSISASGKDQDWLAAQDSQWTLAGVSKYVKDMSGLDQTSSVDYTTLVNLDSQHERSSRGLKSDTEATLNKKYNEWLGGNKSSDSSKMSRSDKLRQKNEELAFNLAVGGRGADIQVTTGNWNFMFGDNIQSILDTNLGSLFGLMTQQFSATGKAGTTFTYNPQDLPRQLQNKLLGKLAGVGADTTLADIFAVDYTADGQIVARNGEAVDGVAILTEMVEVVAEFGGEQLKSFIDPSTLLDSLKSSLDMGKDGLNSFVESHGLKDKAPEELENKATVSVNAETDSQAKAVTTDEVAGKEERPFGFNTLNLPNLFATIFSADKQSEMKSLVTNLKGNLTADLLNMKEATFDFLRNSGHLQGDGDVNVSLGNYNFNWGGDGKDLGAYLGDNNNFWGGRGDDVYYATGTSNIFTGGEGNDMGVLMGRENMMFGGDGDDTAVVAGRINHVFMGDGNDQAFVFGEGGTIESGSGQDYVVTSGNYNSVQAGDGQDYVVTIGNNNQIDLGNGDDFSNVFGNYNKIDGKAGNDVIKLMGYHAVIDAGADDDHLIAASVSKYSEIDGGEGNDLLVLGGYSNNFQGGTGIDSFMVNVNVIDNQVTDISADDFIVFNNVNWSDLWLQRSGEDLQIKINRKADYTSAQAKFESLGLVTFTDYFADNRAKLVISMDAKQESGERDYTALSNGAVDNLVQAMSGFEPSAGDAGFMDQLDNGAKHNIALAWGNVNKGTGHIA